MIRRPTILWTIALVLCCLMPLYSVDVNVSELDAIAEVDIDWENFEGPVADPDTAAAIAGIGVFLGEPEMSEVDDAPDERDYFGKYRVVRSVTDEDGLDADVFYILEDAEVNHIDALRLIVSGYLQQQYGYTSADAALIARYLTIYNAVHRGDLEFFSDRYTASVAGLLTTSGVGIAQTFREWPGQTEIVIPLTDDADGLDALDPGQLLDPDVISLLREREDMSLEERRQLVDLVDRVIEEQEQAIEEAEEAIEEEQQQIDQEQDRIEREREEISEQRDTADADEQEQIEEREDELDQQQDELAEREEELEEQREEVREQQEEVEQAREQAEEEREQIATDTEEVVQREEAEEQEGQEEQQEQDQAEEATPQTPVYFLRVAQPDGAAEPVAELVQVLPATGELVSDDGIANIRGRRLLTLGGQRLAIIGSGSSASLALIDLESFAISVEGEDEIFPGSALTVHNNEIFAVLRDEGAWHLGRFSNDLSLIERSAVEVEPYTYIQVEGPEVWIQASDGTISSLSIQGLDEE